MPIDKFGRTDGGGGSSTNRVVSSGLTPSQASNLFLRRDGANDATADISMGSHKLTNVAAPTNAKDGVNKEYTDGKVSKSGDTLTGDLVLSSAVQPTSTTRRLGCTNIQEGTGFSILLGNNFNKIDYEQVLDQNPVIFQTSGGLLVTVYNNDIIQLGNKELTPLIIVHTDIAMNSHKIRNLSTPVNSDEAATKGYADTKVDKTGDTIAGNLSLSVGGDLLRTLGCSDLTGSKGFSILLGSILNQIQCQLNTPITLQTTDGFLCRRGGNDIIRFGASSTDSRIEVYQDILMNRHYISNLHDPTSPQDAVTRSYCDANIKKCYVGFIPRLTSNVNYRGFVPSASSEFNGNYSAANAFKGDYVGGGGAGGEWATAGVRSNFWIQIKCPTEVRTWKFGFRGRDGNVERIYSWKIEQSSDGLTWSPIYTATNPTYLGNTYQEFLIDSLFKYRYYRLYCFNAEVSNPGLSTFQMFVYDD